MGEAKTNGGPGSLVHVADVRQKQAKCIAGQLDRMRDGTQGTAAAGGTAAGGNSPLAMAAGAGGAAGGKAGAAAAAGSTGGAAGAAGSNSANNPGGGGGAAGAAGAAGGAAGGGGGGGGEVRGRSSSASHRPVSKKQKGGKQPSTMRSKKEQLKITKMLASEFEKTHHSQVSEAGDIAVPLTANLSADEEAKAKQKRDRKSATLALSPRTAVRKQVGGRRPGVAVLPPSPSGQKAGLAGGPNGRGDAFKAKADPSANGVTAGDGSECDKETEKKEKREREKERKEREKREREKERERKEKERERERERKEKERKEMREREKEKREKEKKERRGRTKEKEPIGSRFMRALSPTGRARPVEQAEHIASAPAILRRTTSFILRGEQDDPSPPPKAQELTKFLLYHMEACLSILELCQGDPQQMLCSCILTLFQSNRVEQRLIMFSLQKECQGNSEPSTLFRDNTAATQLLSMYCKLKARSFVKELLEPVLSAVREHKEAIEVDPNRAPEEEIAANVQKLTEVVDGLLTAIFTSVKQFPSSLKAVFKELDRFVKAKYPDEDLSAKIVGGFFFLRFLCPMIVAPDKYGLLSFCSAGSRRTLILITKIIQNMSNGVVFGKKEVFMLPFNELIDARMPDMEGFLRSISNPPSDGSYFVPRSREREEGSYATSKALRTIVRSANAHLGRLQRKLAKAGHADYFDTLNALLREIEQEEGLGWRPVSDEKETGGREGAGGGGGGDSVGEEEMGEEEEEEEKPSMEEMLGLRESLRQCEQELLETKERLEEEVTVRKSLQDIIIRLSEKVHFLEGRPDSTNELRKSAKMLDTNNRDQAITWLTAAANAPTGPQPALPLAAKRQKEQQQRATGGNDSPVAGQRGPPGFRPPRASGVAGNGQRAGRLDTSEAKDSEANEKAPTPQQQGGGRGGVRRGRGGFPMRRGGATPSPPVHARVKGQAASPMLGRNKGARGRGKPETHKKQPAS